MIHLPLLLHDRVIRLRAVLVILALVFLLLLGVRLLWARRTGNPFIPAVLVRLIPRPSATPTPIPTPTPTPTPTPKPIPSGKQTFSVSSGKKTGPQFRTGTIDPYDPRPGSEQVFTITITGSRPVTTVRLTMATDTKSRTIPLKLIDGSWTGSWTVDDTYLYTYNAVFTASDGSEENKVELTLR